MFYLYAVIHKKCDKIFEAYYALVTYQEEKRKKDRKENQTKQQHSFGLETSENSHICLWVYSYKITTLFVNLLPRVHAWKANFTKKYKDEKCRMICEIITNQEIILL